MRARQSGGDIRSLAIAWLPFLALYGIAASTLDAAAPAMLKIAWFAFSFVVAYASTALFDPRDVARGYFLSYLVIAAIITFDFISGLTRGPEYMIGFGQRNEMVPGMLLFRPHAFYYEPSFAASGLALAWALALTRMRDAAPHLATALVVVGGIALIVMTSRTGWLYAAIAGVAVLALRGVFLQRSLLRAMRRRIAIPVVVAPILLLVVLGLSDRAAIGGLLDKLGFAQTFERVCPRVVEQFGVDFRCLQEDERRRFLNQGAPIDPDETPEGRRLADLRTAMAKIAEHPWLGVGVNRGADRFIAPPVVPNLWIEVAVEGGLLTLLAFALGLGYTLWRWRIFDTQHRDILVVIALWFLIVWQFIENFPRLDLWVALWVVLVWTRGEASVRREPRSEEQPRDESLKGLTPLGIATR